MCMVFLCLLAQGKGKKLRNIVSVQKLHELKQQVANIITLVFDLKFICVYLQFCYVKIYVDLSEHYRSCIHFVSELRCGFSRNGFHNFPPAHKCRVLTGESCIFFCIFSCRNQIKGESITERLCFLKLIFKIIWLHQERNHLKKNNKLFNFWFQLIFKLLPLLFPKQFCNNLFISNLWNGKFSCSCILMQFF